MSELTYEYLRSMNAKSLQEAAESWTNLARYTSDTSKDLYGFSSRKIGPDVFDGEAANATRQRTSTVGSHLEAASEEAEFISRVLSTAVEDFDDCISQLGSVVDNIESIGYQVSQRGIVSVPPDILPDGIVPPDIQDEAAMFTQEIAEVVKRGQEIDDHLTHNLTSMLDEGPRSEFDSDRVDSALWDHVLSGNASPEEVNDWWNNLPEDTRSEILRDSPEKVAWLDGVPSKDRDTANRAILEEHVRTNPDDADAAALLEDLDESGNLLLGFQPAEYETRTVGRDDSIIGGEYEYDVKASDWQVIVATGDPDDADNIATFVPGTGSDTEWGSENSNTKLQIERTQALADEANAVSDENTVGIMWMGYDAPDEVMPNAMSTNYASNGAEALQQFTEGVTTTNQNDARHTVVGHSYGSTLVGWADQEGKGLSADAAVLAGSPGPGPDIDTADDFSMGEDNVYIGTSPNDPIKHVNGVLDAHGENMLVEDFGGTRFDAGDGDHSSYWDEGGDSLENQAAIITGNVDDVSTEDRSEGRTSQTNGGMGLG